MDRDSLFFTFTPKLANQETMVNHDKETAAQRWIEMSVGVLHSVLQETNFNMLAALSIAILDIVHPASLSCFNVDACDVDDARDDA